MTEQNDSAKPLQFEQAEFSQDAAIQGTQCAACKSALDGRYFLANGHIVCESCSRGLQTAFNGGAPVPRFVMAALFGLGAGAAGTAIWYAVELVTQASWGLIAVVVGFMVGMAVRKGSGGRGGWQYQALAIVITYASIAAADVPKVLAAWQVGAGASLVEYVNAFLLAAVLPFLSLPEGIIGVLIIAFALYEAWKLTKRTEIVLKGPFELKERNPS